jgi:hypothetical protein
MSQTIQISSATPAAALAQRIAHRRIPLVDLAAQQAEVEQEVRAGLDDVFATTAFIGGPQVAQFERAYAAEIGVGHCVGVANGTDALELALRAVGVTAGDEVILPANTFIATAEAVGRIGARPVLVDVDPTHLLIDPDQVAADLFRLPGRVVRQLSRTPRRRRARGGWAGQRALSVLLPRPASTPARTSARPVTRARSPLMIPRSPAE